MADPSRQSDWRWCNRCQGLFYGGNVAGPRCPTGGAHTAPSQSGSADYHLPYGDPFVQPAMTPSAGVSYAGPPTGDQIRP